MSNIVKRPDGKWRARYRDVAGREHSQHFARKVDAQTWLDDVTASVVTGQYVDPKAGKVTFRAYAEAWRSQQVHRPTTQAHVETMLRRHAYPYIGDRPLSSILPSDIQAMTKALSTTLAPATVQVVHGITSGIFKAAVADRKIASNPCESTRLPKRTPTRVEPLGVDVVQALTEATPAFWRTAVVVAQATGMRQGEILGLDLDRVDFLRRQVRVDRQLVTVPGRPTFLGPPKTPASVRTIPLPQVAVDALAEHVAKFPPKSIELVWEREGKSETIRSALLFPTADGRPWGRSRFSAAWRQVTKAAGTQPVDFHELRHFYASLLIRHGESVKVVQARLGHASAAETLDTYSHLWPDNEDRTRAAIDSVLGILADYLRTNVKII